jgi:VanZ family protein
MIWMLFLTVFSVLPDFKSSSIQLTSYKLTSSGFFIHLFSFFIAASLCFKAFKHSSYNFILTSGIVIFLYSILLEVVQVFLPYRTFNYYDILANFVGIGLGIIIFIFYPKFMLKCKI